eukprot:8039454-Karenia_brevis.AAC.1
MGQKVTKPRGVLLGGGSLESMLISPDKDAMLVATTTFKIGEMGFNSRFKKWHVNAQKPRRLLADLAHHALINA